MRIEEAIQQKKFKSSHEKAFVNLIYTSNLIHLHQSQFFKEFDLTGPQYNVLRILRGQHPESVSINLIIGRMLDRASNASRLVEKLRAKGLVSRVRCKNDRRQVNVKITDKGLELLTQIDGMNRVIPQSLTNEEAEQFSELLDKLRTFYTN